MREMLTVKCGQCNSDETVEHYWEELNYLLKHNYWHCKKCNSNALYIVENEEF